MAGTSLAKTQQGVRRDSKLQNVQVVTFANEQMSEESGVISPSIGPLILPEFVVVRCAFVTLAKFAKLCERRDSIATLTRVLARPETVT